METTFMTIHNLGPEANILYASESIVDILGFQPEEVVGKSCFDYFHPDEVPIARVVHSRGVQMDKAAVLHYARIINRQGEWVGCECVFTIVYEVLVACTSIYKGDAKNERRAIEAPAIRRLFASSPRDPRYHMLEHLSSKFRTSPQASLLEPRAALILNRFTRTLTVMYATDAVQSILGVTPDQFKDKSFYECMQENCLPEAIRCLESAKANDSIAYLRFWYRDPRREEDFQQEMHDASQSSDSEDGGVDLNVPMDLDPESAAHVSPSMQHESPVSQQRSQNSRTSSGESTDLEHDASNAIFDRAGGPTSSTSSLIVLSPEARRRRAPTRSPQPANEPYEIEAVVSCTSDGLVVVLRRARPLIPTLQPPPQVPQYANGLFAAPWGANPIRPQLYHPDHQVPFQHGLQAPQLPAGGPPQDEFMNSIREVAVFAWSLVGINGNIASYGRGNPYGEAQPPGGLPVWDPYAQPTPGFAPPENQAVQRWSRMGQKTNEPGDGNTVPYQHGRQEELLRSQNGFGSGPMQLDRPDQMGQAPQGHQFAFSFQPQTQADMLSGAHPSQEAQTDWTPVNPPDQHQSHQGPSEGFGGNRYLWY
ncbi:uncharacterized protein LY89DRAFT_733803 [Mollisia scopiformis]|uniref:PAS domain-containing protein n=1 Tax=Mollisia scopiformis TaxID=149040 RepID=A0A194X9J6_MOLSC|nr:uncharacterized protein LY89DRAFT_733803 [Mollisia scopiformis]KUJ16799.1 hypothetical protein LY89DRAFT_733803 [Mollisia scopiformis]